jgi:hypothetical protein|tara:strand:+ start:6721 stop:6948 length:228 start_codon:yes stop_codon:yes gene_type:complete
MPRRQKPFGVRKGMTQPVRTMPEQDETGKGHSGPHSGIPIRRQIDAQGRNTEPRLSGVSPQTFEPVRRRLMQPGF